MPAPAPHYELGQFFDLSTDLLCIAGLDGYFKRLNPSFERVLGYSREELMSRPFLEFMHADDVERARDAFIHLATGEGVIEFECRLVCVDGSLRRLEWNTRTSPHEGVVYGIARGRHRPQRPGRGAGGPAPHGHDGGRGRPARRD